MSSSFIKRHIRIETENSKEQLAVGSSIHHQLVGNKDYIDSNIVVNLGSNNEIDIYITEEARETHIVI